MFQISTWLKLFFAGSLALIALIGVILPVAALIEGDDVNLSGGGATAPDIEIDGQFLALTYFRKENDTSISRVFLKSATNADGWLTSQLIGFGRNPQLAFRTGSNIVYVVWVKDDFKAIQSAKCTLSSTAPPACVVSDTDVQTSAAALLNYPDVVVDSSNRIHVVWVNNGTIQSRFTSDPDLKNWSAVVPVGGGGSDDKPVLARSGSSLHLALLRGTSQVVYFRSGDSSHSWGSSVPFAQSASLAPFHNKFDHPSIAASGNQVYIAWDARRTSGGNQFSLIQTTSANNGTSWTTTYAPSDNPINGALDADLKVSLSDVETPGQEAALRPSLAISSGNAALVWQQIPDTKECADPTPATIHFASPIVGSGFDLLANDGDDDYMIDPDIATSGGVSHIVYMRDADATCPGQLIADYVISYRGPFTKTINDRGEGGAIFLPNIRKNN